MEMVGFRWSGIRQVDPLPSSSFPLTIQGRVAAVGSVRMDNCSHNQQAPSYMRMEGGGGVLKVGRRWPRAKHESCRGRKSAAVARAVITLRLFK